MTTTITRPPFSATAPYTSLTIAREAVLCSVRNQPDSCEGLARAAESLRAFAAHTREVLHLIEMGVTREQMISLLRQSAYAAVCEAQECETEVVQIAIDSNDTCPLCSGAGERDTGSCYACDGKGYRS